MRNILITHKNCMDGIGCVLAVREYDRQNNITNREIIYAQYGKDQEKDIQELLDWDNDDRCNILIGDFSFKRETLILLHAQHNEVVVIDHHATAQKDLEGLDFCIFDMTKSGAVLVWEYLFPTEEVPILLQYIQDRDIWTWNLQYSKEVSAGLTLIDKKELDVFETHMNDVSSLASKGHTILEYQQQTINKIVRQKKYLPRISIGGYNDVICINTTTLISEIGNALVLDGEKFVAMYFDTDKERVFSLRANGEVNVAFIAKQYGGGGHPNAAGFSIPLPQFNLSDHLL